MESFSAPPELRQRLYGRWTEDAFVGRGWGEQDYIRIWKPSRFAPLSLFVSNFVRVETKTRRWRGFYLLRRVRDRLEIISVLFAKCFNWFEDSLRSKDFKLRAGLLFGWMLLVLRVKTICFLSLRRSICLQVFANVLLVFFLCFTAGWRRIWHGTELRHSGCAKHKAYAGTARPLSTQSTGEFI